jgi:hypothetical protein
MPIFRYFLFVGGSLLALILVANAALPSAPVLDGLRSGTDLPLIRIRSERKLPERVVIDTSAPMPAGAVAPVTVAPVTVALAKPQVQARVQPVAQAPIPPATAEMSAKARVREAFAQLPPEQDTFEPKMSDMATVVVPEPKMYPARQPLKQKAAIAKPRYVAHPMMMAQQPRGVFSTW